MTATRQDILRLLAEAAELAPDVRVGQLVAFLPQFSDDPTVPRLAEMEDDDLLAALRRHVADLAVRTVAAG